MTAGARITRLATPGYSYLSSNDPRAHFGVPRGVAIERIEVAWPDGSQETFAGGPANRIVELTQGTGR